MQEGETAWPAFSEFALRASSADNGGQFVLPSMNPAVSLAQLSTTPINLKFALSRRGYPIGAWTALRLPISLNPVCI